MILNISEKIIADFADIENNEWKLKNVTLLKPENGIFNRTERENYQIISIYNYEKITTLFKNFDTMSFLRSYH